MFILPWFRFEGVSWNLDETLIAYVAEAPSPTKPVFNNMGYKKGGCAENDFGSWNGQGEWEEDWGETYAAKRQPTLFVININRFFIIHIHVRYYLGSILNSCQVAAIEAL